MSDGVSGLTIRRSQEAAGGRVAYGLGEGGVTGIRICLMADDFNDSDEVARNESNKIQPIHAEKKS
jgi:hypothetical protein